MEIMCFSVVDENELRCMARNNNLKHNIFEAFYIYHSCGNIEKLFMIYENNEIITDIDLQNREGFLDGYNYKPIKP